MLRLYKRLQLERKTGNKTPTICMHEYMLYNYIYSVSILFSLNFKFLKGGVHEPHAGGNTDNTCSNATSSSRAMVGSRRLEEVHGHRVATTACGEETRGWRRGGSTATLSRAPRTHWSAPLTIQWLNSSPPVRAAAATQNPLTTTSLPMNDIYTILILSLFSCPVSDWHR